MRTFRYTWMRRGSSAKKTWGIIFGLAGAVLIIKILPLWIWPFGIGLWLLWAGLGPLVAGGALIWIAWRMLTA